MSVKEKKQFSRNMI